LATLPLKGLLRLLNAFIDLYLKQFNLNNSLNMTKAWLLSQHQIIDDKGTGNKYCHFLLKCVYLNATASLL